VVSVDETVAQQNTPLNAALAAGLEMISYDGEVEFFRYVRLVMPVDGTVFWVRADLINPSQVPKAKEGKLSLTAQGSFHYATDLSQEEAESFATNRVVFTSITEVVDLNIVDPAVMYIGEHEGIRFAFGSRGSFYRQADIFHYVGHAVYSVVATQIIDDPTQIDTDNVVVSNSLPIWLSMNNYVKPDYEDFAGPVFTLYPSFLAPQNQVPPYGTVHVEPGGTMALAAAPNLDAKLSHSQLMRDMVRVTLYGVRNSDAMEFVDFVNQFSVNTDLLGVMNMPAMRDDKRTQVEFNTLAQRKSIDYEVSYYQTDARNAARQLIKTIIVNYFLGSAPPVITSNGGGPTATIAITAPETQVTVVVVSSMAGITFALSGVNAEWFRITTLGVLVFNTPPVPGTYVVAVRAGNLYGQVTQTITVVVS